jgi:hypothetical protein
VHPRRSTKPIDDARRFDHSWAGLFDDPTDPRAGKSEIRNPKSEISDANADADANAWRAAVWKNVENITNPDDFAGQSRMIGA